MTTSTFIAAAAAGRYDLYGPIHKGLRRAHATMLARLSARAFSNPAGLYNPAPHGYSHLARVPAGSELLLVAGQGGFAADLSLPPDLRAQFRRALANVETALAEAGATLAHVARTTLLVVGHDAETLTVVAEELVRAWPDAKPASTLIPVQCLALPGMLVEIEATAALPIAGGG